MGRGHTAAFPLQWRLHEMGLVAQHSAHDLYIQLYASYANTQTAFLSGRVLRKHRRFRPALPADGIGTNLLNTYFRMYSQEVSGVRVRLHLNEHTVETVSDNEGYIFAAMPLNGGLPAGTHTITASVLHTPFKVNNITLATANCFLPPPDAAFGVISDIDDTTIVSKTYSPWRMLYTILCVNAHRRTAVQGVPQWYNTLHENGKNPFFYVSSSPWNIYDILTQVFDLQHVPQGAILLRDYGIDPDKFFLGTHSEHKQKAIDKY